MTIPTDIPRRQPRTYLQPGTGANDTTPAPDVPEEENPETTTDIDDGVSDLSGASDDVPEYDITDADGDVDGYGADDYGGDDDDAADGDGDGDGIEMAEATAIEVLPSVDGDPFEASLSLLHHDQDATGIGVWLRLTPTVIGQLQDALANVLAEQHTALGIDPADASQQHQEVDKEDDTDGEEDEGEETFFNRARDPLGLRHIRSGSPQTFWYVVAGAVVLVIAVTILGNLGVL